MLQNKALSEPQDIKEPPDRHRWFSKLWLSLIIDIIIIINIIIFTIIIINIIITIIIIVIIQEPPDRHRCFCKLWLWLIKDADKARNINVWNNWTKLCESKCTSQGQIFLSNLKEQTYTWFAKLVFLLLLISFEVWWCYHTNGESCEKDDDDDVFPLLLGTVHILRNTNLGSRETPPHVIFW